MSDDNCRLIFADVLQNMPRYLCMDNSGLYLCSVVQHGGQFEEKDVRRIDNTEAMIFMAGAFNRAMESIGERRAAE